MSTVSAQWREQTLCKAQSFGGLRRLSIRCLSLVFFGGWFRTRGGAKKKRVQPAGTIGKKQGWLVANGQVSNNNVRGICNTESSLKARGAPKKKNSTGNSWLW